MSQYRCLLFITVDVVMNRKTNKYVG